MNSERDEYAKNKADFERDSVEKGLYKTISNDYLRLEEQRYRNGWVLSPEAKLLFLVGTEEMDITKAKTFAGFPIYTKQADHIKAPEITEAMSAISDHFERKKNVPNVLSELADVWYNLIQLTQSDRDVAPIYHNCIRELCTTVGYSLLDAYRLTIEKYKIRLQANTGVKKHTEEIAAIESLLNEKNKNVLPVPKDSMLNEAYRLLNKMSMTILKPRLMELQTIQDWKRAEWQRQANQTENRTRNSDGSKIYLSTSTIKLLNLFKDTLHPKSGVVIQPITGRGDEVNMGLSLIFSNTRYITQSQTLAETLANIGYMTYLQDPLKFELEEKVDILFLDSDQEFLLSSVAPEGYVIRLISNSHDNMKGFKPVGTLSYWQGTEDVFFRQYDQLYYQHRVLSDTEFKKVSAMQMKNKNNVFHLELNGGYYITYDQAAAIVQEVTGKATDIVTNYKRILLQLEEEKQSGKQVLTQVFSKYHAEHMSLPDISDALDQRYVVYQRINIRKNKQQGNR